MAEGRCGVRAFIHRLKDRIALNRRTFILYSVLRGLVLLTLIRCIMTQRWEGVALCVLSLVLFAYLLTLVPSDAAGRAYAAYGGVYIGVALLWLWQVDGVPLRWSDWLGAALSLAGMMVIMWGSKT